MIDTPLKLAFAFLGLVLGILGLWGVRRFAQAAFKAAKALTFIPIESSVWNLGPSRPAWLAANLMTLAALLPGVAVTGVAWSLGFTYSIQLCVGLLAACVLGWSVLALEVMEIERRMSAEPKSEPAMAPSPATPPTPPA
jgi:hypothetical protein